MEICLSRANGSHSHTEWDARARSQNTIFLLYFRTQGEGLFIAFDATQNRVCLMRFILFVLWYNWCANSELGIENSFFIFHSEKKQKKRNLFHGDFLYLFLLMQFLILCHAKWSASHACITEFNDINASNFILVGQYETHTHSLSFCMYVVFARLFAHLIRIRLYVHNVVGRNAFTKFGLRAAMCGFPVFLCKAKNFWENKPQRETSRHRRISSPNVRWAPNRREMEENVFRKNIYFALNAYAEEARCMSAHSAHSQRIGVFFRWGKWTIVERNVMQKKSIIASR